VIGPGTGVRVYVACGVTDMRKGIAGLSTLAQDVLRQKPASGAVFAFRGRRGDRLNDERQPSWPVPTTTLAGGAGRKTGMPVWRAAPPA